jgi:hypothetical protein
MSNRNIYNAARGYMVANAIAGGVASELAAENRRQAARLAEASLFNAYYISNSRTGWGIASFAEIPVQHMIF